MSDFSVPFNSKGVSLAPKEIDLETKCCRLAEAEGWEQRKLGDDGWPDRMFLKDGVAVFVEFKRPNGGHKRALQIRRIARLTALGFKAFFCDSVAQFRKELLGHVT